MRVLNVNITLDPVYGGGTAERTFQMSRFLAKCGHECSVLTLDRGLTPQRRKDLENVELVALPCLSPRFHLPRFGVRRIQQLVAAADVIHLMGHWNILNVLVHFFARRLGKPYVICPAGELAIFGRSRLLKSIFNSAAGRRIVQQAGARIAVTERETTQFAAYGVDPETVTVIPNGINPKDFQDRDADAFRAKYGLGDRPFVLFMGRLNAIKGPDLLVRAFTAISDQFPDYQLVVAGPDGGMGRELNQIAESCSAADRIRFLGYLACEDKSRAYHAADLLVIPSRQEAMSIVVLEAGIAGTPVLITDQCGFNQVAGIGGGHVVPATVEGLQSGLVSMLETPAMLNLMGEQLRRHVLTHFCWDTMVGRYVELYEQLIEPGGLPPLFEHNRLNLPMREYRTSGNRAA